MLPLSFTVSGYLWYYYANKENSPFAIRLDIFLIDFYIDLALPHIQVSYNLGSNKKNTVRMSSNRQCGIRTNALSFLWRLIRKIFFFWLDPCEMYLCVCKSVCMEETEWTRFVCLRMWTKCVWRVDACVIWLLVVFHTIMYENRIRVIKTVCQKRYPYWCYVTYVVPFEWSWLSMMSSALSAESHTRVNRVGSLIELMETGKLNQT